MESFLAKVQRELYEKIDEIVFERCEGCLQEMGNQMGHTCVTLSPEERIMLYFNEAFQRLNSNTLMADLAHALEHKMMVETTSEEVASFLYGSATDTTSPSDDTQTQCCDINSTS